MYNLVSAYGDEDDDVAAGNDVQRMEDTHEGCSLPRLQQAPPSSTQFRNEQDRDDDETEDQDDDEEDENENDCKHGTRTASSAENVGLSKPSSSEKKLLCASPRGNLTNERTTPPLARIGYSEHGGELSQSIDSPSASQATSQALGGISPELSEKLRKFWLKKKQGASLSASLRRTKHFNNPTILDKLIEYHEIDQIGTNYPKEVFDPHRFEEADHYDAISSKQAEAERAREQAAKNRTSIDFQAAGTATLPVPPPSTIKNVPTSDPNPNSKPATIIPLQSGTAATLVVQTATSTSTSVLPLPQQQLPTITSSTTTTTTHQRAGSKWDCTESSSTRVTLMQSSLPTGGSTYADYVRKKREAEQMQASAERGKKPRVSS
ncbi:HCNGP-like protein [Pelomyxa schiedti]|nr:HCNGP-like protein [Pelomyxa schiedti]